MDPTQCITQRIIPSCCRICSTANWSCRCFDSNIANSDIGPASANSTCAETGMRLQQQQSAATSSSQNGSGSSFLGLNLGFGTLAAYSLAISLFDLLVSRRNSTVEQKGSLHHHSEFGVLHILHDHDKRALISSLIHGADHAAFEDL